MGENSDSANSNDKPDDEPVPGLPQVARCDGDANEDDNTIILSNMLDKKDGNNVVIPAVEVEAELQGRGIRNKINIQH